jgi:hypothetical protein
MNATAGMVGIVLIGGLGFHTYAVISHPIG